MKMYHFCKTHFCRFSIMRFYSAFSVRKSGILPPLTFKRTAQTWINTAFQDMVAMEL
jgi:hypothetical protein